MERKTLRTIKFLLLITGTALIFISSQFRFCTMLYYRPGKYLPLVTHFFRGTEVPIWYVSASGALLLFLLSYFRNSLLHKIGYYTVLGIVLFLISTYTISFTSASTHFFNSINTGFYLEQSGLGLIVIATLLFLHQPRKKKSGNYELLDSEL